MMTTLLNKLCESQRLIQPRSSLTRRDQIGEIDDDYKD